MARSCRAQGESFPRGRNSAAQEGGLASTQATVQDSARAHAAAAGRVFEGPPAGAGSPRPLPHGLGEDSGGEEGGGHGEEGGPASLQQREGRQEAGGRRGGQGVSEGCRGGVPAASRPRLSGSCNNNRSMASRRAAARQGAATLAVPAQQSAAQRSAAQHRAPQHRQPPAELPSRPAPERPAPTSLVPEMQKPMGLVSSLYGSQGMGLGRSGRNMTAM